MTEVTSILDSICKTDANDYELYFLIPAETEKPEFDRLEKEAVTALLG